MRLFFYYATHSLLNTLKKLLKTWVAIFLILMVGGGLIGGIMGTVFSKAAKENGAASSIIESIDDSAETDEDASDSEDEIEFNFSAGERFSNVMKKYDISTANVVDILISALFLVILATNVANSKSSGKIFQPADVTMMFSAPLKPQSVLLFRLTCALGISLFFSLFMLYQVPNLMNGFGFSLWGAFSCVVVYMLILMISTLIQVAFYTITSKIEGGTENINKFLIAFYGLIGLGFIAYVMISKQEIVPAVFNFFASPSTHWIPFWGWLRGISYYAITGEVWLSLIYLGLFLVSCMLVIFFIWKMKADFYDDAMFAAERKAEAIENARRASNGATVIREKERKASLERDGFHYGSGANVFFYKAVFNRFRFAKLKIFSTVMIIYILVAGFLCFMVKKYGAGDMFFIPASALAAISFYRTLGDPIREDTSREFFLLIPENGYSKIFYSLLGCLAVTAIDLALPMVLITLVLQVNPLMALMFYLFILSVSFFATTVGTFIALSIPGESAKTIKTVVQILFMYFGLGPSAIAILIGVMFHQLLIALAIGLVINFAIGFLVSFLLPKFLGRR